MTIALAIARGWSIQRLTRHLWLVCHHGAYLDMAPTFPHAVRLLAGRMATEHV